jgi:hypothetical protein
MSERVWRRQCFDDEFWPMAKRKFACHQRHREHPTSEPQQMTVCHCAPTTGDADAGSAGVADDIPTSRTELLARASASAASHRPQHCHA